MPQAAFAEATLYDFGSLLEPQAPEYIGNELYYDLTREIDTPDGYVQPFPHPTTAVLLRSEHTSDKDKWALIVSLLFDLESPYRWSNDGLGGLHIAYHPRAGWVCFGANDYLRDSIQWVRYLGVGQEFDAADRHNKEGALRALLAVALLNRKGDTVVTEPAESYVIEGTPSL